ncbi:hypothetical protein CGCF413_v014592 [Colletotrichum fructicola]|nr:hypothetical protein CGCF413_v014592 [Colletotrichum fructicola]
MKRIIEIEGQLEDHSTHQPQRQCSIRIRNTTAIFDAVAVALCYQSFGPAYAYVCLAGIASIQPEAFGRSVISLVFSNAHDLTEVGAADELNDAFAGRARLAVCAFRPGGLALSGTDLQCSVVDSAGLANQ